MNCPKCLIEFNGKPNFCPACGFSILFHNQKIIEEKKEKNWKDIKFVIIFYCILFATLLSLKIYPALEESFLGDQIVSWLCFAIVLFFLYFAKVEKNIISLKFNYFKILAVVTLALVLTLSLNVLYHNYLLQFFNIDINALPDENNALITSIYYLAFYDCLMPAISEELAFRTIIFEKLKKVLSNKEAILLTSILFAILHVDFYATPYLFFVGLTLGWLRQYAKSLLPCMLFHFLHNLFVTLHEANVF